MNRAADLTGGLAPSQPGKRIKTLTAAKTARAGAWTSQGGDARRAGDSAEVGHAPPQGVWEAEQQRQTCDHSGQEALLHHNIILGHGHCEEAEPKGQFFSYPNLDRSPGVLLRPVLVQTPVLVSFLVPEPGPTRPPRRYPAALWRRWSEGGAGSRPRSP